MVIPEAAVEAAARSLYRGQPIYDEAKGIITGRRTWEAMEPEYQEAIRRDARAALESASPYMGWWEMGDVIEGYRPTP